MGRDLPAESVLGSDVAKAEDSAAHTLMLGPWVGSDLNNLGWIKILNSDLLLISKPLTVTQAWVSLPWHYGCFGPNYSLFGERVGDGTIVHCRLSEHHPWPLLTGSHHQFFSCDDQKCPQTLPDVPRVEVGGRSISDGEPLASMLLSPSFVLQ